MQLETKIEIVEAEELKASVAKDLEQKDKTWEEIEGEIKKKKKKKKKDYVTLTNEEEPQPPPEGGYQGVVVQPPDMS